MGSSSPPLGLQRLVQHCPGVWLSHVVQSCPDELLAPAGLYREAPWSCQGDFTPRGCFLVRACPALGHTLGSVWGEAEAGAVVAPAPASSVSCHLCPQAPCQLPVPVAPKAGVT